MLKRKCGLNYRNAGRVNIKDQRCCWFCTGIVWTNIYSCAFGLDKILRQDWRCKIVGVQSGRSYTVGVNNLCDRFIKRHSAVPEGRE